MNPIHFLDEGFCWTKYSGAIALKIGINEAILLSELCSEYNFYERAGQMQDGMFFATKDRIYERTALTRYQQDRAYENLKKWCLLDTIVKGVPPKTFIKLDKKNIEKLINDVFAIQNASNLQIDTASNLQFENASNLQNLNKKYSTRNNNENDIEITPLPPTRGKRSKPEIDFESLPSMTESFETALRKWIKYRKEIKKPITQTTVETLVDEWRDKERRFIVAVDYTIGKGWQGLREPEQNNNGKKTMSQMFEDVAENIRREKENEQRGNVGNTESDFECLS